MSQIIRDCQSDNKTDKKELDKLSIRTQVPKTLDSDPSGDGLGSDLPPDLVPIDYCMEGYGIDGGGGAGGGFVKVCLRVYLSYNGQFIFCIVLC